MELELSQLEPIANARRHTLNGREYVIADAIILREGVLNGSKGPLFYPADEIQQRAGIWNGFPLTANHPTANGRSISARSPQAWNKFTIGHVFNDSIDVENKVRKVEAWFDVELSNKVDSRIIPAVLSGKQINVSTGLFTSEEVAPPNSTYNGKQYTAIARNYTPDHLAVLMDDLGACSVKDGCGININSENPMRDQLVQWLTTNCECWKGKDEVLKNDKNFTEEDLKKLKDNVEKQSLATNALKEIGKTLNAPDTTKLSDLPTLVKNMDDKMKKAMDDEDEEGKKDKTMNKEKVEDVVANYLKNLPRDQRLGLLADKEDIAALNASKQVLEEKRIEIIKQLTANIKDDATKKARLLKLKNKSLDDLRELLEFAGTTNTVQDSKTEEEKFLANFYGAQGASDKQTAVYNREDVLLPSASMYSDE